MRYLPIRQTRLDRIKNLWQSNGCPVSTPKPPKVLIRVIQDWWLELLAIVLNIATFSSLVAVLGSYQNRPLPKWPLDFSFNTALSLLGLLFRASSVFIAGQGLGQLKWRWISTQRPLTDLTIYDEASRGPWGSTKLLWVARWRDVPAFLGAFITVAALGMDPFTQAIVSYYECKAIDMEGTSSISRTNSYFGMLTGLGVPTSTRAAIDTSFRDSTSIMPNYTCTTDTCTFSQLYHSVGLCSRCFDVTDELDIDCEPFSGELGSCNYTLFEEFPDTNSVENTTAYSSVSGYDPDENTPLAKWQVFSVQKYNYAIGPNGSMLRLGSKELPSHQSSTIDLVSGFPVLGARCSIYFCVRTYTAIIDHGVLREALQSTSDNWSQYTNEARALGTVEVDCLTSAVRSKLLADGYITPNTKWMSWNSSYLSGTEYQEQISLSTELSIPARCAYQIQLVGPNLVPYPAEFFSEAFSGVLQGFWVNESVELITGYSSLLSFLYNKGTISVDSLNSAFDDFTSVTSNYMRTLNKPIPKNLTTELHNHLTTDPPNSTFPLNPIQGTPEDWNRAVSGLAFTDTTCIHVRWPWLSLPAALFVGTLIFLTALFIQTCRENDIRVWKSSQIALLWHGLDGPAKAESVDLETVEKMNHRAKSITVRLEKTAMGWKLVQD